MRENRPGSNSSLCFARRFRRGSPWTTSLSYDAGVVLRRLARCGTMETGGALSSTDMIGVFAS